ncbi:hypothetical protein P0F65_02420 [Sphingomonas sp. I4]
MRPPPGSPGFSTTRVPFIGASGTARRSIAPVPPGLPALVAMAVLPSPLTFNPPGSAGRTL